MSIIVPTLLATSEEEYKICADKLNHAINELDNWVQIDLMDNKFAPNLSIGLETVSKYPVGLKKEAHLMVTEPNDWIDGLVNLDFQRIIFPIEIGNTKHWINEIKNRQVQVGISINPDTNVDSLIPFLSEIDLVLIMSVNPGFQGQEFKSETWEKIAKFAELKDQHNFLLSVDGGVKLDIAKKLVESGVDSLAVGSALFKGDFNDNLKKFKEVLNG